MNYRSGVFTLLRSESGVSEWQCTCAKALETTATFSYLCFLWQFRPVLSTSSLSLLSLYCCTLNLVPWKICCSNHKTKPVGTLASLELIFTHSCQRFPERAVLTEQIIRKLSAVVKFSYTFFLRKHSFPKSETAPLKMRLSCRSEIESRATRYRMNIISSYDMVFFSVCADAWYRQYSPPRFLFFFRRTAEHHPQGHRGQVRRWRRSGCSRLQHDQHRCRRLRRVSKLFCFFAPSFDSCVSFCVFVACTIDVR